MSRRRDKRLKTNPPPPPTPRRGVAADMSKQAPNNSWGGPVMAYFDTVFRCRDRGREEVWTAEQQKWYYEVAKGPLYAKAVRCADCRKLLKERKRVQSEQMRKGERRTSG